MSSPAHKSKSLQEILEAKMLVEGFEFRCAGASFLQALKTIEHADPKGHQWREDLKWFLSDDSKEVGLRPRQVCEAVGIDYDSLKKEIVALGIKRLRKTGLWEDADALSHWSDGIEVGIPSCRRRKAGA